MVYKGGAAIKVDQQRAQAKRIPELETTESINDSYHNEYGTGDEWNMRQQRSGLPTTAHGESMDQNIMIGFPQLVQKTPANLTL